jgi:hypothetical protein
MNVTPLRYHLLPVLALAASVAACSGQNPAGVGYNPSLAMQSHKMPNTTAQVLTADFTDNAILGFRARAKGDPSPTTVIAGSNTMIAAPEVLAIDSQLSLYTEQSSSNVPPTDQILVFAEGANGNVAPTRVIGGSNTLLGGVAGLAIDPSGYLWVSDNYNARVSAFAPGANGNVSPAYVIGGSKTDLQAPVGIATDQQGRIYVANLDGASILIFAKDANGNVAPVATIAGTNTKVCDPTQVAIDPTGRILVVDLCNGILVFAAGASGNVAPLQQITSVVDPSGVMSDSDSDIWVSKGSGHSAAIEEFASNATGNATPMRKISGHKTTLAYPTGLVEN